MNARLPFRSQPARRVATGILFGVVLAFGNISAQDEARRTLFSGILGGNPAARSGLKVTTHTTRTSDGWEISMKRYVRDGRDGETPKAAVILCHGFNINNLFWDLEENTSLARFLADGGYDVWAPSLRGSGRSSKPILSRVRGLSRLDPASVRYTLPTRGSEIMRGDWSIDDHVRQDVPAIVDFVRARSGFDKVYWVGHSMGGIILFGYLATGDQEKIAGFIAVGSMMVLPAPLTPNLRKIANQKPLLTVSLLINTTVASQLSNVTLGALKSPVEGALLNRGNMNARVLRSFLRMAIDDTSPGVVGQFTDSIRAGEMLSRDGGFSYTRGLSRVRVPLLFMAGNADGFVTPGMLRASYDAVGSRDKEVIVISRANGASADYGHCDLLIGENSPTDVYPRILDWLERRTDVGLAPSEKKARP